MTLWGALRPLVAGLEGKGRYIFEARVDCRLTVGSKAHFINFHRVNLFIEAIKFLPGVQT